MRPATPNIPEFFAIFAGYACFRPVKQVSLDEATELVCTAVAFARENLLGRLLVDITHLTGFDPPTTFDRFKMACQVAGGGGNYVKIAVVAKAEFIDPERFGIAVAQNLGTRAEIFTVEDQAITWLMSHKAVRLRSQGGR
jgi:hypothetical protein